MGTGEDLGKKTLTDVIWEVDGGSRRKASLVLGRPSGPGGGAFQPRGAGATDRIAEDCVRAGEGESKKTDTGRKIGVSGSSTKKKKKKQKKNSA